MRRTPLTALAGACAATALTLGGLGPLTTSAAAEDTPGITVEALGVAAANGGYPTIYFGFYGLAVTFTDTTVDAGHRYVATATEVGGEGVVVEQDVTVWEGWDGEFPMQGYLPNEDSMQIGDTFEVVISEYDGKELVEQSAPESHTVAVVSHPEDLDVRAKRQKVFTAGEVVKLRWTGAYGDDVGHVTQVIAARKGSSFSDSPRDFLVCQNSHCPTAKGTRWVSTKSRELTTRFRIPARFAGKTLVISIYGQPRTVDGVEVASPWGFFIEAKVRR